MTFLQVFRWLYSNQDSTVRIALRRQQPLWCDVCPSCSPFPRESVQVPLFPQLVEMTLEFTSSLHCKHRSINVRGGEALPFFSLDFEPDFQKEGKCDGMGPATEVCWSSVVLKEGAMREKLFTALCKMVLQIWTSVGELEGLWMPPGADQGDRNCSHLGLLYLLASSRWAGGNGTAFIKFIVS